MEIQIPEQAAFIIDRLRENGFEAYVVGGCVRDSIMGRSPKDWDITTSAKPDQVKGLFHRTLDTGILHGTVTVMLDKCGYEVTTYRIDGEYEDSRHPKNVEFTTNLIQDLKRRDFTINAMAYNPITGLVDAFGGLEDIRSKKIRCVGRAVHRFEEDALRMLRAVRFSGQLDFEIETETAQAILEQAQNIEHVSAERIRMEVNQLLISQGPEKIKEAFRLGLTKVFLPEFDRMMETNQNNPHHIYNVGEHSIYAIKMLRNQIEDRESKKYSVLCWTLLLHDVAKPFCKTTDDSGADHFYGHDKKGEKLAGDILQRLRFDNYTIETACRLIRWHDYGFGKDQKDVRRAASKIGADIMPMLFAVQRADAGAQDPKVQAEKEVRITGAENFFKQIEQKKQPLTLKELAVNGKDLIKLGVLPGKEMGRLLVELMEEVLEYPEHNTKEFLINRIEQLYKNDGKNE